MILRYKPLKLEQLEILKCRAVVAADEVNELGNLKLGWEGEGELDRMIDERMAGRNCIHLKDYRFSVSQTGDDSRKVSRSTSEVQIDNIFIAGDRVFTFEVKKYNFDLVYSDTVWTFTGGDKFKNLMQQVSRHNDAFRYLLRQSGNGADFEVYSCLVFINPKQTIYNLPYGKNILTYSGIEKFLDRIVRDNHYSHDRLLDFLESRRLTKSMYDGKANIELDALAGGVYCEHCYRELERVNRNKYNCVKCNENFDLLTVTRRLINELKMLNEDWKLDSSIIAKYSGHQISSSYIRRQKQRGNIDY